MHNYNIFIKDKYVFFNFKSKNILIYKLKFPNYIFSLEYFQLSLIMDQILFSNSNLYSNNLDKKWICEYDGCMKTYSTHGNLKTHHKTHIGKKN